MSRTDKPDAESNARDELSSFLRTRRARLSPEDVGLPDRKSRRTRGLRREDVASLAGVGLTWYTWLEQGRPITVSTSFLEQLARALKLSGAERIHLFALAQGRPPPLSISDADSDWPKGLQAILDAINRPAYARSNRFDVLAWNAANTSMFGNFANVLPRERNVLRLMFSRPYYRQTMPDWEKDARSLVAKFRMNYGQAGGAKDFANIITDLSSISPDFCRMWADHDVSNLGEGATTFLSRRHGKLMFVHQTMMPEALTNIRIVVFIPTSDLPDAKRVTYRRSNDDRPSRS